MDASLVLLLKTNIWAIGGCINFWLDFLARFSLLKGMRFDLSESQLSATTLNILKFGFNKCQLGWWKLAQHTFLF
jgi:hypothetical protein